MCTRLGRSPRGGRFSDVHDWPVFSCPPRQLDDNFIERYNRSPCRYPIDNPESSVVMNMWYRGLLGDGQTPLETQVDYALNINAANSWCGKIRACMCHPQIVARMAIRLAFGGVALGVVSAVLGVLSVWLTLRSR